MFKLNKPCFMLEADGFGRKKKLILEIAIFLAVFSVGSAIQSVVTIIPMMRYMFTSSVIPDMAEKMLEGDFFGALSAIKMPGYLMLTMLFATAGTIVVSILYCRLLEKRPLRTMGFTKKGAVSEYLLGMLIGTVMISCAIGICAAAGVIEYIKLSPNVSWIIILYFIAFIIQGMSEEVLLRGYFMVSMSRQRSVYLPILLSSAIFALMHVFNPGITIFALFNIFLFGVFMAVYVIKRGNLWGAAAIHTMWNFVQSNIFGVEVSGMEVHSSLLVTKTSEAAEWLHGGAFGSEGGLDCTVILLAAILLIWLLPAKREKTLQ